MRRIDVFSIGLLVFLAGGALYIGLKLTGMDALDAGRWSQFILVIGLLGWVATYLFRVTTGNMTLNQQLDDYETAVLEKRLEELSPEEIAKIQQELEQESNEPK